MMKIYALWTPEQVAALNASQASGRYSPMRCEGDHVRPAPRLVAYEDGWQCWSPECEYTQDWAYEWMADPQMPGPPKETLKEKIMREMPEGVRLALAVELDQPSRPGPSGNGEDCRICSRENLPYPFLCRCPRYALHSGTVRSETDGRIHPIGVSRLARLYKLEPGQWLNWDARAAHSHIEADYIHLFPRCDGDYRVPGRDY
jgi:hypothetical protein